MKGTPSFSSIKLKLDSKFAEGQISSSNASSGMNESSLRTMHGATLTANDANSLIEKWTKALEAAKVGIVKDTEAHLELRMNMRTLEKEADYLVSKLNAFEAGHDVMKATAERLEERSVHMNKLLKSVKERLKTLSSTPELRKYQTNPEFDREKTYQEACELQKELTRICNEFEDLTDKLDGFKLNDLKHADDFDLGKVISDMSKYNAELSEYTERFEKGAE